jgi:ATP-dependent Clp protease ATP-binding subunit ClpC
MATDLFDDSEKEIPKKQPKKGSTTPILDTFSRDLVKMATDGKIDPVVGRESETKRICQILTRKRKNNVLLTGLAGCGKTALVEKLALLISKGNCPTVLVNKRIMALDLTAVVAGTKYRGQFEERIKAIIDECRDEPNVIVFIDEIHTMIGAGNGSGALDASNILKPALARGEIQCIGATTHDEYKKHIEKDAALSRRFQKINLTEPTAQETIFILENLRESYEKYHRVSYGKGVFETIVKLSKRYLTNKQFPDKAIDVLDELGSEKRINSIKPKVIEDLNNKIEEVRRDKIKVVKDQDYEVAAELRDKEKNLTQQLEIEIQNWITS